MRQIHIPNNWNPRGYQLPGWNYLENGGKHAVFCWHRRSGKDSLCLNWTATAALQRPGNYWHLLPKYEQARKAVWEAIDKTGRSILDQAFPDEICLRKLDNRMFIEFHNGSTWQLIGSDNVDTLVGPNPVGVVFSEYSLSDPRARDFLRPILSENGGWEIYNFTPRGKNHAFRLFEMAKNNPDWFAQKVTVDDSNAIPLSVIEDDRKAGMDEDTIQQEYYCSFNAAIRGAFYGKLMNEVENSGRIINIPHDPNLPVHTAWDLGYSDSMAVWFIQTAPDGIRLLRYMEWKQKSLADVIAAVRQVGQESNYIFGTHLAPHDINVHELTTGTTRIEAAQALGLQFTTVPRHSIHDRIDAVKRVLPRCWFHRILTEKGRDCLTSYRADYDDKNEVSKQNPVHDWSSHCADAFGYFAIGQNLLYASGLDGKPSSWGKPFEYDNRGIV